MVELEQPLCPELDGVSEEAELPYSIQTISLQTVKLDTSFCLA